MNLKNFLLHMHDYLEGFKVITLTQFVKITKISKSFCNFNFLNIQ